MFLQDEGLAAVRELREETGYEGEVTYISPVVHCDPGMTNASMRYVFMRIDGDKKSNQMPQAIPDDGEILEIYRIPAKDLLNRLEKMSSEFNYDIDARLYGVAYGLHFHELKKKTISKPRSLLRWTLAIGVVSYLAFRWAQMR